MITLRSLDFQGPELRVLIVDDEPIARQVLREELEALPGNRIVGEAENGMQALDQVHSREPDVVFLDLQMPGMSGFETVRKLDGQHLPIVVFVTAYDQYAIQAFEAGAVDYLLKPVRQQRLAQTLERVRGLRHNRGDTADALARQQEVAASPATRKIVGRQSEEYVLLDPDEVMAFQADGDIVWIMTARQRYQATQTLKVLQERLAGAGFERVHRSALVNVKHVRKLAALSSQRWLLTLANGQEFTVSKRQARGVRHMLDW